MFYKYICNHLLHSFPWAERQDIPLYRWANRGEISWTGSPELESRSLPATLHSPTNCPPLPKSVLWAPQKLACIWHHHKMISSYLRLMFWCHHLLCIWVRRVKFYTSLESQGFLHTQNITHRWHFFASQSLFGCKTRTWAKSSCCKQGDWDWKQLHLIAQDPWVCLCPFPLPLLCSSSFSSRIAPHRDLTDPHSCLLTNTSPSIKIPLSSHSPYI